MGPQPKRCHNCKSEDHLIADCPTRVERPQKSEQQSSEHNGNGEAAAATSEAAAKPE
jgi:protein lin-28